MAISLALDDTHLYVLHWYPIRSYPGEVLPISIVLKLEYITLMMWLILVMFELNHQWKRLMMMRQ